jgi:predicted permease
VGFVLRDFRYGLRIFRKAPAFSAAALFALALGMGATTAVFSIVDAVLWKPLPFREPGRLLVIWEKNPALDRFRMFVAPVNYREWQRQSTSLEGTAAILSFKLNLTRGPNGPLDAEELKAERVSASLLPLLGVQPVVGRAFQPEEDQPGRNSFALISHSLWTRRLGAEHSIVGRPIQLGSRSVTVVGVMPSGFSVLDPAVDIWIPLGYDYNNTRLAAGRNLVVIGRLRDGVRIEQAQAEFENIGSRLELADPALNKGWRPSIFPLMNELVGKVERALVVFSAAVACLLFMACANVANLLLARGVGRRKGDRGPDCAGGGTRAHRDAAALRESAALACRRGGRAAAGARRAGAGRMARRPTLSRGLPAPRSICEFFSSRDWSPPPQASHSALCRRCMFLRRI